MLEAAIQKLVRFAEENPAAGVWGGRTLFGDKTLNPASCWRKPTVMGNFLPEFYAVQLFSEQFCVQYRFVRRLGQVNSAAG